MNDQDQCRAEPRSPGGIFRIAVNTSIRIVLIDTAHPGNIGAVARAMKNMAVDDLALVRPKLFPSEEATARASGADDLLTKAKVVGTLDEAVAECSWVIGTTSRSRTYHWNVLDVRAAAEKILSATSAQPQRPVAILFGSERFGLTNDELSRCNWLIRVPANPEYESLNLAMAVQIVCYEMFMAKGARIAPSERETPLASAGDMERMYAHLDEVLKEVDFVDRTQAGSHLMGRFRRLFGRAELDQNEVNILRGLLTAVQGKRRTAGGDR